MRVGLVAGEHSGDALGAGLIRELRARSGEGEFFGIAGDAMREAGCEAWAPASALSVMGLAQVVPHLRRLLRLRREVCRRLIAAAPDVFVGIDAKEFNLTLSPRLRDAGLLTVQYVSPQVWAWRPGRIEKLHRAVDLVLCVLPFEKPFLEAHGVRAVYVGHPLADAIALAPDRAAARLELGLPANAQIIALLPGSRRGEVSLLAPDFARIALRLHALRPALHFVAPMASAHVRTLFERSWTAIAPNVPMRLMDGGAQRALMASDAALVASGTATLEAALCKCPMVVVYRLDALSAWLIRKLRLVKSPFFSQPNLLAGERVVGEYFQNDIDSDQIAAELISWLDDSPRRAQLTTVFTRIHEQLRCDANARAAQAIVELVRESSRTRA